MYLIKSEIPALLGAGHHPCNPSLSCIEEDNDYVPLEDCWYARPQLLFICYLRPTGGRPPKNANYRYCPDDLCYHLVFFSTLRSWNLPSAGQWSVLGWPSCMSPCQHPACMWHQQQIWLEEFHWFPCSWLVTWPLPFLTSTASTRGLASRWEAVTLQQLMAGVAAMSMRWTSGCGCNLGVASHAWVVCQLKRLVPRRRLLRRSGSCAEQRLAGIARLIGLDGK
jgi:hypothetical protein